MIAHARKTILPMIGRILCHPLFLIGIGVRILLCLLIAPDIINTLFLPFITDAVTSGWMNAYTMHAYGHTIEPFPYPPVMLAAFAIPIKLALAIGIENQAALSFIVRSVLLCADITILVILAHWLRHFSLTRVLLVYWLSPALLYISYIHGQLDVLPIALLVVSFYFLFRERLGFSGLFLALAVCAKTHIAIILPFYFLHIIKNGMTVKQAIPFACSFIGVLAVILGWAVQYPDFVKMVFENSTQEKVFALRIAFDRDVYYYIWPALYFVTLLAALRFVRINRDLSLALIGISFALVAVCVPPTPGWYYWFLPFMAYFVLKNASIKPAFFLVLQGIFLLFFEYGRLVAPFLANPHMESMVFTALQTMLIVHIYLLYRHNIKTGLGNFAGFRNPYLIAVSGDSGSGKTTLSKGLENVFGKSNLTRLCGDGMHKWERGHVNWKNYTHLDPSANQLHDDYFNFRRLKAGASILRREYDHDSGQFTEAQKISPKPMIISEGLHAFYLQSMRSIANLKIFMHPSEAVASEWKIARDTVKRGHDKETVLQQISIRKPDRIKYIEVQEKHADIIFEIRFAETGQRALRVICNNNIYGEALAKFWSDALGLGVTHSYMDECHQQIEVLGEPESIDINEKAEILLPQLRDVLYPHTPKWPEGFTGLMCQLVAYAIFYDDGVGFYQKAAE